MLLRFISDFSEIIKQLNQVYTGDVHKFNSDIRRELDELNYSYYDILERQDERISHLESELKNKTEYELIEENNTAAEIRDTKAEDDEPVKTEEDRRVEIKKLYNMGRSAEEIAVELGLGQGYVDLILSLYAK